MSTHHTLRAHNLLCPMPVIRTQNLIKTLAPGDTLEVICTDPGAENDVPAWCRINGHQVVQIDRQGREIRILIKVGNEH
ncbi:MAG: sulfurtransferase TusA family protein [Gammaproteobacteria bacterium]|nr:sulfurtransferase TusA family protein [Gammaproteobacteria bacterium]